MTFKLGIMTELHADLGAFRAALQHMDNVGGR